jgi:hypothetical protein
LVHANLYFCAGAATAFATGVAGGGVLLLAIGRAGEEAMFWFMVTLGVGADLGFPDPDVAVDTVRTVSFSGQNKIARIAMTSRMITMVGQWAFVNDQSDDACAACGTVFAVAGWVCATVGVDGVVAGVVGALFTATGEPATGATATGADAGDVAGAEVLLPAVATVFAIATSVLCIPLRVAATDASCEGVSVVLAETEALNCESVVASVFRVPWNALTCVAVSPAEAEVVGVAGTAADTPPCDPVPAMDAGIVAGVPASTGGTVPACISRFASVAFATSSCC